MFNLTLVGRYLPFALLSAAISGAQNVNNLTFGPLYSAYSTALDRIIMVSAAPNELHIYDPVANIDTTVALGWAPLGLSLSPDGLHAAVAHSANVSLINLQTATLSKTYVTAAEQGLAVTATYIYAFSSLSGSTTSSISSINLSSGQISVINTLPPVTGQPAYDAPLNILYAYENTSELEPLALAKLDISNGPVAGATLTTTGTGTPCGEIDFSPDGTQM